MHGAAVKNELLGGHTERSWNVAHILDASTASNRCADWVAANVVAASACVDTIELFFPPYLTQAARDQIVTTLRAHDYDAMRLQPSIFNGVLRGWRLSHLNQPDACFIYRLLDDMQTRYRAPVARLDIAVDWMMRSQPAANYLQALIERTGLLRWRRGGAMIVLGADSTEPTVYWNNRKGRRRCCRNLVVYTGKLDPFEPERTHLELRSYGTAACRRLGIVRPSDLVNLDPAWLFARYVGLSLDGVDRYLNHIVRQQVRAARRAGTRFDGSRLARDIRYRMQANGQARAQWLKTHRPKWLNNTVPITALLPIPARLWLMHVGPPHLVITTLDAPDFSILQQFQGTNSVCFPHQEPVFQ